MKHQPDHTYLAQQTAHEMLASSDPHQKALVRIMSLSHEYEISPVEPIKALAYEQGRRHRWEIFDFAEALETEPYLDAVNGSQGVFSAHSKLALNLAEKNGTTGSLFAALQDLSLGRDPIDSETTYYSRFFRLTVKVMFVFAVLGFIAVRLIPEFRQMLLEFGVETPGSLDLLIRATAYFPLILAIYGLLVLGFALFTGNAIRKFFRRWSPSKWRQPIIPPKVNRLRGLALISQPPYDLHESVKMIRQQGQLNGLYPDFVKLERTDRKWGEMLQLGLINKSTFDALGKTSDFETRSWLLRWVSRNKMDQKKTNSAILMQLIYIAVNLVLVFLVALVAVSVFSILVTILEQLGR